MKLLTDVIAATHVLLFSSMILGHIVDVAAMLRDCMLREAIVQFHRNGVRCLTYHCFTLTPIDLVRKRLGTRILGKRNSKRSFIR